MPRTRTAKNQPTLGTRKKLQALQRQVNANEREVQHAIRKSYVSIRLSVITAKNLGEKEARKKLKACQKGAITRPRGTAGRHFNLQQTMNLDDKDTMCKRIRVSTFLLSIYVDFYRLSEVQDH